MQCKLISGFSFTCEGNRLRTVTIDGEPWFVARDVCDMLEIKNPTNAVQFLDDDEKTTLQIVKGGPGNILINEPGLYSLILRSRKPEAKPFKRWECPDTE